jgi:hypothetical protein
MSNVSTFLDELAAAAGGSTQARRLLAQISGETVTPQKYYIWRLRGIPYRWHDPMRRCCTQLGLPADPGVWRKRTPTKQVPA